MYYLGVLLFVVPLIHGEKPHDCRPGWVKNQRSCYLFEVDDQSWAGARSVCDFLGAKLVKIETDAEDNFLKTTLQTKFGQGLDAGSKTPLQFWTGGNQFQQRGVWMWSEDEALSHTGWGPNNPVNIDDQNCVALDAQLSYSWGNIDCSHERNFICEIELADDTPFGRRK